LWQDSAEQENQDRTAKIGQSAQNSLDRTFRKGNPGQDRTVETGQNSYNKTARTGQLDRAVGIVLSGQVRDARIER
jgi:hypothetical protein